MSTVRKSERSEILQLMLNDLEMAFGRDRAKTAAYDVEVVLNDVEAAIENILNEFEGLGPPETREIETQLLGTYELAETVSASVEEAKIAFDAFRAALSELEVAASNLDNDLMDLLEQDQQSEAGPTETPESGTEGA